MLSGLVVHDLTQYAREWRPAVASAFSVREGIGILGIVPGSGADRASLQIDDEILAVGGVSVQDSKVWAQRMANYDRIDRFQSLLASAMSPGQTRLTIRRAGKVLDVAITGRSGCGGLVKFVDSGSVNAWSDGTHVVLNRGLVDIAQDEDQLAFVIAHEMAHNILGHFGGSSRQSRALFGRLFNAASPRNSESQADLAAVALSRDSGYDPRGGVRFLAVASRRMWWAISLDRPSFGTRARAIAAAIDTDDRGLAAVRVASIPTPARTSF